MYPLTAIELSDHFDLDAVLDTGSISLIWVTIDRRSVLEIYVRFYLREQIRAEGLVRNLPGFARFLSIAALYHDQVVNIFGIARDCGVARATVQDYLDILEDTFSLFASKHSSSDSEWPEHCHPKLYWVNSGSIRAVKKLHGPIAPEERVALLEGWVLYLLRAHAEGNELFDDVYYWAPHLATHNEVDFVLLQGNELMAIEVKTQSRYHTDMLSGLRAIAELRELVRCVLIYGSKRSFRTEDGINVWSTDRLLQAFAEKVL